MRRRRSWPLCASALLLALGPTVPALAQANLMMPRIGPRIQQDMMQQNVRQAVRPRLVVRGGVAGGVRRLELSADGRRMVTVLGDGSARVWDMTRGSEERPLPAAIGASTALAMAPDGARLFAGGTDGSIVPWELAAGTPAAAWTGHAGAVTALAASADGRWLASGGTDRAVRLRDLRAAAAPRGLGSLASPVAGIIVGNDGSVTAIGTGGELGHWRAGGGASAGGGLTVPGRPVALAPAGDGAVIVATADGALHRVDTRLRQVATLAPVDRAIAVAAVAASGMVATAGAGDGAVQLRDPVVGGAAGGAVRTLDAGSPVAALAFDRTGTRLFAASADGFVRLWDARAGVLLAQALSTEGGWAVLDPAGRFDGSAQGMDDVRWQAPQVALPIESFSATYYEPGLLARQGAQPAAAALAPAPVPRIEDGIRLPPQARLEAVGAAAGGPPQPFELRVVLIDQGGGIEEARVFQNGKRVPPSSILRDETGRSGGAATRTLTVRATPIPGANRWEAVGIGTGRVEGLAATLDLTFAPPARRPTLHLVTVGINDYAFADVERRLRFAVPDAKAVAARLAGQRAAGFETVERYGLYDRQATRAEILGVLDRLKGVPADDVVAVYLAGHGETVGGDWHFVTYDVTDLEDLRSIGARGLSAPALRDALLAVGAERVVLMVDACKSGGAVTPLADVADRRALREMAKSAGLHVLAATGRDQLTPEFATLGHGSFTYVVLDGLAGAADRAPRDGWVSIRELIGHAERRLPGFTRDQVEKAITLMMRAQTSRGLIEQIRGQPIPIPTAFSRGADFTLSRIGSR